MIDDLYEVKNYVEFCVGMVDGIAAVSRDTDLLSCFENLSAHLDRASYTLDDIILWAKNLPVNIEMKYRVKGE